MRRQIAAANWKMNLSYQQAESLLNDITAQAPTLATHQQAVFAVPFPYLTLAVNTLNGLTGYSVAAQNCSDKKSGAYTGEVSVDMLQSVGVTHVIVGHSERREYYHESNELLAAKLDILLEGALTPIFCCGEPLQVREAGNQNAFVAGQLRESLYHLDASQLGRLVIAYEPIWAIGTGKTASSQQAQDMHAFIRSELASQYGQEVANGISILYGGSVKADNAAEIFSQADVDGGLVGGASLKAAEFLTIIRSLK